MAAERSKVDMKDLCVKHKKRYDKQYFISEPIPNPSLHKTETDAPNQSYPCTDIRAFLCQQNKTLVACAANHAHIAYFIVNKWLRGRPVLVQFDWLILIKADQLERGLDTAICEEILECCEGNKRQSVNFDDMIKSIKKEQHMVIIEGNVDELPREFRKESLGYEYVIFCVKPDTDLHAQVLQTWNQTTTFHFDFTSTEQFNELEDRMQQLVKEDHHQPSAEILEGILDKLSELQDWPVGMQGMYAEDENIIIDVAKGSKNDIEGYLHLHATDIFTETGLDPKKNVNYVEQEDGLEYCVRRGGEICKIDDNETIPGQTTKVLEKVLLSPNVTCVASIDELCEPRKQSYGTVACVTEYERTDSATSDNKKRYCVLTSHHIFLKNLKENVDNKSKLDGHYFGENGEALNRIAKESYGILGNIDHRGVDISVIPVQPQEIERPTVDQPVPKIYEGTAESLLNKRVEKLGATKKKKVPTATLR